MGQQYVPAIPYPELQAEHDPALAEVQVEHPVEQANLYPKLNTRANII